MKKLAMVLVGLIYLSQVGFSQDIAQEFGHLSTQELQIYESNRIEQTEILRQGLSLAAACFFNGSLNGKQLVYTNSEGFYGITLTVEAIQEEINGYDVVRVSGVENDMDMGAAYISCDPVLGTVLVAIHQDGEYKGNFDDLALFEPPLYFCQYGDAVGHTCEWNGTYNGPDSDQQDFQLQLVTTVVAYEDVTVPAGTFSNTMKLDVICMGRDEADCDYNEEFEVWIDNQFGIVNFEMVDPRGGGGFGAESDLELESVGNFCAAEDSSPPQTFHRLQFPESGPRFNVFLDASDDLCEVDYTEFRFEYIGGTFSEWQRITGVIQPSIYDTKAIQYRSVDTNGNVETLKTIPVMKEVHNSKEDRAQFYVEGFGGEVGIAGNYYTSVRVSTYLVDGIEIIDEVQAMVNLENHQQYNNFFRSNFSIPSIEILKRSGWLKCFAIGSRVSEITNLMGGWSTTFSNYKKAASGLWIVNEDGIEACDYNLKVNLRSNDGVHFLVTPTVCIPGGCGSLYLGSRTVAFHYKEFGLLTSLQRSIIQQDGVKIKSMQVDSDVSQATFSLFWEGSELALDLLTPSGVKIDSTTASNDSSIVFIKRSTSAIYTIDDPETGNWITETSAIYVNPEGEDYALLLFTDSNLSLTLEAFGQLSESNGLAIISGQLTKDNVPVTNATIEVDVEKPDGMIDRVSLFDDGTHNDLLADDGVYTTEYVLLESGVYGITALANGTGENSFERVAFVRMIIEEATGTSLEKPFSPEEFALEGSYPNPFDSETRIDYRLSRASEITLNVFNVGGQLVATIVDGFLNAGNYTVTWDGRNNEGGSIASGIYFITLKVGDYSKTISTIYLRND